MLDPIFFVSVTGNKARRVTHSKLDWSADNRRLQEDLSLTKGPKSIYTPKQITPYPQTASMRQVFQPRALAAECTLSALKDKPEATDTDTIPSPRSQQVECLGPLLERVESPRSSSFNMAALDSNPENVTWTESTENPDYNLTVIHSTNTGFEAKARGDRGSDFTYEFVRKMKRNITKSPMRKLQDICYGIQEKLHKDGRSLPQFIFNNETRHIVFQKNDGNGGQIAGSLCASATEEKVMDNVDVGGIVGANKNGDNDAITLEIEKEKGTKRPKNTGSSNFEF